MIRKIILTVLCLSALLVINTPIIAQSTLNLILYPPDLDQFPKVTLYLDAYDGQGKFIPGMDLNSFAVFEDGIERIVNEAQQLEPGLHTIIAINLGATLSNRANTSIPTRYEETVYAIASWLNNLGSQATNQYSFTSNEGVLVENAQEKDSFTYILQNYKPNLFNFEPDLTSLSLALDMAAKPNLVSQSKQAILYITPLPIDQDLANLSSLQARALEIGIPINVWLVAPDTASNAPAVQVLNQLATATGGKFLFYTENSKTPDPEDYVGWQRNLYRLRYTSSASQSGTHIVRVSARYGNLTSETPETQFSINLNLPSATLVNLPTEIKRDYSDNLEGGGKNLQPTVITLQADIAFPDGYERQLKATRLYVDGKPIVENTEEPFVFFGWPLEDYSFSGEHLLAVEVEDILGFRSISPPVAVMVTVASLYPQWLVGILKFLNQGGWIPLAIIGMVGSIFFGLRLRRKLISVREIQKLSDQTSAFADPMLQTIPGLGSTDGENPFTGDSNTTLSNRNSKVNAPRLVWAEKTKPLLNGSEILLTNKETVIGSDASQVNVVIAAAGISAQHARLVKNESGSVTLADLGSETGTWVNYAPVSKAGVLLHHSDLVQFGNLTFRYFIGTL